MLSIDKEPAPGIKGKEALDLITRIMKQYGIDRKFIIVVYYLLKNSVRRKRTIYPRSIVEEEIKRIIEKFKDQLNHSVYRQIADEILDLFYDDPEKKMHTFIKDNNANIIVVLTLISIFVSILIPIILKFS